MDSSALASPSAHPYKALLPPTSINVVVKQPHDSNPDALLVPASSVTVEINNGAEQQNPLKQLLTPLGAAFVASIAYVDPGNFATNVQGGSEFGYTLLWVVAMANIMAMLFQLLSAKLGIASHMDLGRCCRERLPSLLTIGLWVIAEIAAIATDIAEFVGASVGFKILTGMPLIYGAILTAMTTFVLLLIRDKSLRFFEVVVVSFIAVIVMCFIIETIMGSVDWSQVGYHIFVPELDGSSSALLAVGIVGATVMPHAIYLHSALTLDRKAVSTAVGNMKQTYRYELSAIIIALGLAGFVNMAVLTMAASSFNTTGNIEVATLEDAYETLTVVLGRAASYIFAIGLIASGISSSAIGTLAGQIVMEGFLDFKMSVWLRRLITLIPSIAVILSGVEPTKALVVSQVVLSFCIPFALVPLVVFTSNKQIVGEEWCNRPVTIAIASLFTAIIVGMNIYLIYATFAE